jgi:hypothetical protein
MIPYYLNQIDLVGGILGYIDSLTPVITGDFAVLGELSPAIVAIFVFSSMPRDAPSARIIGVLTCALGYLLFLQLRKFMLSEQAAAILNTKWQDIDSHRDTIVHLVTNIRVMILTTGAAILGVGTTIAKQENVSAA